MDKKWLPHVAVALAYAAGFALLRSVSFSHWELIAGFRLSVLLLAPYRYWPALLLGEMGPLAYTGLGCWDDLGIPWSLAVAIPHIGLAMPIVYFFRKKTELLLAHGELTISLFLLCALFVSVLWSIADGLLLSLAKLPPDYNLPPYRVTLARWFLGHYLGILTITPLIMMLRHYWLGLSIRQAVCRAVESHLWFELMPLLLSTLAMLAWLLAGANADIRQTMQMLMFVPVVWLALRRGWHGAAVGGTFASIVIVLLMPGRYDQQTMQAQVFLSFAITAMLLLGGRIALLLERGLRENRKARFALALAQRHVQLSEVQLRQTAQALEQVREAVGGDQCGALNSSRRNAGKYVNYREVNEAKERLYRLADTLYPVSLQEKGVVAALREGPMARALDEAGMSYWFNVREHGLDQVSASMHTTLYRLVDESVAYLCQGRAISGVQVRLRVGSRQGHRWAFICVDGRADPDRLHQVRWSQLLPRVRRSSNDVGLKAICDRARIFQGRARMRVLIGMQRISIVVFDPSDGI